VERQLASGRIDKAKSLERAFLDEFRSVYPNFPSGHVEPEESPDFLVRSTGRTTGIEVTKYTRGRRGSASPLRQGEEHRKRVAQLAREMFEKSSRARVPLMVHLSWFGRNPIQNSELIPQMAETIGRLVLANVPTVSYKECQIESSLLDGTPLDGHIHSIHITRLNRGRSVWAEVGVGFISGTVAEIQSILTSKEPQLMAYRSKCDHVWLLIVAESRGISTHLELTDEIRIHPFMSGFDSAFVLNRAHSEVVVLKLG